jgi:Beta-propeller repeat
VDAGGSAYITGVTFSPNFPNVNPIQAHYSGAFLSTLSPTGSALVFSSYFGGSGFDEAGGIARDPAGNIYITGSAFSSDFPLVMPFQSKISGDFSDAFVSKFSGF